MKICSVKFKTFGNSYFFTYQDMDLKEDDKVIVDTENGEQFAIVTQVDVKDTKKVSKDNMKKVIKIASDEDYEKYLNNIKDASKALKFAKEQAEKLNLDMKLIDASYTFDKKQLVFNFFADDRVDFRELVKILAAKFKTRIELHQVGVRDKAAIVGGIGMCGRKLCCSSFLSGSESISINMAKNQNIALNPSKINGLCGRLLCCLSYEDETYEEFRKKLPKMGERVNTPDGSGKVVSLDIINLRYSVDIDGVIRQYDAK